MRTILVFFFFLSHLKLLWDVYFFDFLFGLLLEMHYLVRIRNKKYFTLTILFITAV